MRTVFTLLLTAAAALPQQTAAPTPATVGASRGENLGAYNLVNSFETGYRFRSVGGDLGKYRSDVNYGNGVRLLSSLLTLHSREGRGRWLDELVLSTQGLGNDPYQSATLRLQKNRLYRYDLLWRSNDYYNPALPVAFGQHLMDTQRRFQDHDIVLLPQSPIRLQLGYTRNAQDGPALTTVQQFGSRQDEFPLLADVRRVRNEYRLGGEVAFSGFKLVVVRGWDRFREDSVQSLASPSQGDNPGDRTVLNSLRRTEPLRGDAPYWRLALFREGRRFAANGRFVYVDGRRDFVFEELATGVAVNGAARNRQILVSGGGRRPVSAGNLTLSLFPTQTLTLSSHTSFHNTRMDGDAVYREINNAASFGDSLYFNLLGVRAITNLTDLNYRPLKWFGVAAGYHYATRRIRSREQASFEGEIEGTGAEQESRLHAAMLGLRFQPAKSLRISLDGEIGRADRPFTPLSERNYHSTAGRIEYRSRQLTLSAAARSSYNFNSVSLSSHSSQSRTYSLDASWSPRGWLGLDAGYSKLHLDTLSGLAYFLNSPLTLGQSLYVSNLHAANLGIRAAITSRADLYLGYSRVQDTGDGRAAPSANAFEAAQVFPLTYQTPLARLSVKLHSKLRWNLAYQYYGYGEQFGFLRDYRAHTGYTSVLWSF